MKRVLAVCSVFAVMTALAVIASAQGKGTNFAGTWSLDKSKSQLPQMMADRIQGGTWTVTQDDKQLTRDQKLDMVEGAGPGSGPPGGGGGAPGARHEPLHRPRRQPHQRSAPVPGTVSHIWQGFLQVLLHL